jgi:hypothetical protein
LRRVEARGSVGGIPNKEVVDAGPERLDGLPFAVFSVILKPGPTVSRSVVEFVAARLGAATVKPNEIGTE